MSASPRGPLPPLRVCPRHGASFRSWKEGALGPCCRSVEGQEELLAAIGLRLDAELGGRMERERGVLREELGWRPGAEEIEAYRERLARCPFTSPIEERSS